MNSLSIIIYLISILDASTGYVRPLLFISTVFIVLSFLIVTISNLVVSSYAADGDSDALNWFQTGYLYAKQVCKVSLTIWIITSLFSIFVPSKQYAVLIAASEIGERMLQTEEAQKFAKDITGLSGETTELLRTYIRQQTLEIKTQITDQLNQDMPKATTNSK